MDFAYDGQYGYHPLLISLAHTAEPLSLFNRSGNRGVDGEAARYLSSPRGTDVLPYVGVPGEPPEMESERRRVAAPFYVLSQSFVKFLIARVGLANARELWALSQAGAEFIRANATEQLMPGLGLSEGALEVSNVDADDAMVDRLQMLGKDFDTAVEGWPEGTVNKVMDAGEADED